MKDISSASYGHVKDGTLASAGYVKEGALIAGGGIKAGTVAGWQAIKGNTVAGWVKPGIAYMGAGAAASYSQAKSMLGYGEGESLPSPPGEHRKVGMLVDEEMDEAEAAFADDLSFFEIMDDYLNLIPSFNPVYYVALAMSGVHGFGIPWWGTFLCIAIPYRLLMLPAMVTANKYMAIRTVLETTPKVAEVNRQLANLKADTKENNKLRTMLQAQKTDLQKAEFPHYHWWKFAAPYAVNAIGWMSIFLGARRLIGDDPTMTEGGLFWFTDMTVPDPYFLLPGLSWTLQMTAAEIGFRRNPQSKASSDQTRIMTRFGMHGFLAVFTLGFGSMMPSGIMLFWCTTAFFTVCQNLVVWNPTFRKWFEIPDRKEITKELKKYDFPSPVVPKTIADPMTQALTLPADEKAQRCTTTVGGRARRFNPGEFNPSNPWGGLPLVRPIVV